MCTARGKHSSTQHGVTMAPYSTAVCIVRAKRSVGVLLLACIQVGRYVKGLVKIETKGLVCLR